MKKTEEQSNGDEFIYIIRVRKRNKTSLEKLNTHTHQKKIISEENFSEQLSHKYIVFRFDSFRFVLFACLLREFKASSVRLALMSAHTLPRDR